MRWGLLCLVLVALLVVGPQVFAEGPDVGEQIKITAQDGARYEADSETFSLSGNVRIVKGNMVVTADFVRLDMAASIAYITGNIKLVQNDVTIGAEQLVAKFTENRAEFKSKITLVKADDELELTADTLDLDTKTQDFTSEGNIRLVQKKKIVYAQKMVYAKAINECRLTGNVVVETAEKETLTASEVVICVKDNSLHALGGVEVIFYVDSLK